MIRRKPKRKADAILIADLHLTENQPSSRLDSFLDAQDIKLKYIRELSEMNDCPVICAGDVFDKWRISTWFCGWVYKRLPPQFITIVGNHDLPYHSFQSYEKSGLSLLEELGRIKVLKNEVYTSGNLCIVGCSFGEDNINEKLFQNLPKFNTAKKILVIHELIFQNTVPHWARGARTAREVIKDYSPYGFDVILTGDNHESFVVSRKSVTLVNPGSVMKTSINFQNLPPRCFLYYSEENEIKEVLLPFAHSLFINKEEKEEERTEISAYIKELDELRKEGLTHISFRKNLERYFVQNRISKEVKEVIWKHLDSPNN